MNDYEHMMQMVDPTMDAKQGQRNDQDQETNQAP